MTRKVTFVLNRAAFREHVLQGDGTVALLEEAMAAAGSGDQRTTITATRARVTLGAPLSVEARDGTLSRALGRLRV